MNGTRFLDGQDRVERCLQNALGAGRLAHGLLFTGAPGSGRERAAWGLACGLLCERPDPARPSPWGCQSCRGCRRVLAGQHPDVHLVLSGTEAERRGLAERDGEKKASAEIVIATVRELIGRIRAPAFEGGARVGIVVDAHLMNAHAQNALLKTLEEPSTGTWLILVAPHERAILPTLASRCLRLTFAPRARSSTDAPNEQRTLELLGVLESGSGTARLEAAEGLGKERAEVAKVLRALHDAVAARVRTNAATATSDDAFWADVKRLERIVAAETSLDHNANVQLALETLFL